MFFCEGIFYMFFVRASFRCFFVRASFRCFFVRASFTCFSSHFCSLAFCIYCFVWCGSFLFFVDFFHRFLLLLPLLLLAV